MTKEELIAKMAASAGITKVAAGTALASIHRRGDFLIEKRTTRLSRQFRHLHDFEAKSTNGKESTDRRITPNPSGEGPEIFSRKRASLCCEVMIRRLKRA